MLKIAIVWITGIVILMSGTSISFAYTEEELIVLAEDCATSLALQRKFKSNNKVLMPRNIQLRTGDNCADIMRQIVVISKSDEYLRIWDDVMACAHISQDFFNENGGLNGLRSLPSLPDHIKQQFKQQYKINGKSCLDINNEMKVFKSRSLKNK